ncbi:cell adhesion molecule CEACAM5-like [Pluvialis apricaria]
MLRIFTFQAALCALVILEAHSDVTTIDGRVCDYVIFDLDYPQLEQSFRISWHKGIKSSQRWTHGNTKHGQHIRVFPNGTLGLHVVKKEDAGWYTATVCNSSQHCLYQRKFQLRVHGHLVRGLVGDCVTFDLNCLQSARYIHVVWNKDKQRVAKIRQAENARVTYSSRAHVFPNGSLSRCPTQWGDEGEYVAEIFDQDGVHLHQETFHLELNRVETFKEITELIGGSVFLNLTETKLKHFFQVVWKKENTEIAWTNGSWFWYHKEYVNRSEIVSNYSLRLDRIQKRDRGRYSIEVNDRDGRIVYECIANVKVEQKGTFGRNPLQIPFYIVIVSLGAVIITVFIALIWHFQMHKDRSVWITIPSIRLASLILTDERDNPEECEKKDENIPCSQNDENPSVQGPDGTNVIEQGSKDLLGSNDEADPATADQMKKDPSCQGWKI